MHQTPAITQQRRPRPLRLPEENQRTDSRPFQTVKDRLFHRAYFNDPAAMPTSSDCINPRLYCTASAM